MEADKQYRIDGKPLTVLSAVNLNILPGEFVSVVGRSGCGKSTLLRLIVGLEADYDGDILLDGQPSDRPASTAESSFRIIRCSPG